MWHGKFATLRDMKIWTRRMEWKNWTLITQRVINRGQKEKLNISTYDDGGFITKFSPLVRQLDAVGPSSRPAASRFKNMHGHENSVELVSPTKFKSILSGTEHRTVI